MIDLQLERYISYNISNYEVHYTHPVSLIEFIQKAIKLFPKGYFAIFRNKKYDMTFYYANGEVDSHIQDYILNDELIHSVKAQGGSDEMTFYINITDNR